MIFFSLTGLDQFFQLPSCDVDARIYHELLTTLQEDGNFMLSDLEGEAIDLNLAHNIVVKALKLQEGNHVISSMKLASSDRLLAFTANNANDSVYATLRGDDILLALKSHQ